MASDVERVEVLSDELMAAPLKLSKDFDTLYISINKVKDVGKIAEGVAQTAKSSADLATSTKNLATAQTELEKVQKQFATSTQKLSDDYISNKRALDSVNQAVKDKIALGEKDSKTVNAQNSSYTQLKAALEKNRKMYQDLASEQQRGTKQGQELLKVIQAQDKQFKHLADQQKITNVHVGDYIKGQSNTALAMQAVDDKLGGLIASFKTLSGQFLALATNPFIAVAALLATAFVTLREAAQDYYHHSLEGEEKLQTEIYADRSRVQGLKEDWLELGKTAADTYKKIKDNILPDFNQETDEQYAERQRRIAKAAELNNKQFREHAKDRVDDAQTELLSNIELEKVKDKIGHNDEERLEALQASQDLLEKQLKGDIELAENDLKAYVAELALSDKIIDGKKLISAYSDDELTATKLSRDEITKLTILQEAAIKVESDASEKRKGFYKQRSALILEMQNELEKAAKEEERINAEKLKIEFDQEKKNEDEEIRLKKESDEKKKELAKNLADKQKYEWDKHVEEVKAGNQAIHDAAQEEFDAEMKRIKDEEEARQRLIATLHEYVDVTSTLAMTAISFQTAQSQATASNIQLEIKALDEKTKKEIEAAGDNDNAIAAIEKKAAARKAELDKKLAAEKNKQAKLQHQADVIQGGVVFAQAILEALSGAPPPFNLTLAGITAAVAGIQLAAIVASPIPKFEHGTKAAPGGLVMVGEAGAELIKEHGKPWKLSPSRATIMNLAKDAEVVPHEETMRSLALASLMNSETGDRQSNYTANLDDRRIVEELRNVVASIPDVVAQGSEVYKVFKTREGNRKWIRGQIHGY